MTGAGVNWWTTVQAVATILAAIRRPGILHKENGKSIQPENG